MEDVLFLQDDVADLGELAAQFRANVRVCDRDQRVRPADAARGRRGSRHHMSITIHCTWPRVVTTPDPGFSADTIRDTVPPAAVDGRAIRRLNAIRARGGVSV
jgi:hypothetical protein